MCCIIFGFYEAIKVESITINPSEKKIYDWHISLLVIIKGLFFALHDSYEDTSSFTFYLNFTLLLVRILICKVYIFVV